MALMLEILSDQMHRLPRDSAGNTLFLFFASFRRSKSALCHLLCEATCSLRTDKQLGNNVTSVDECSKTRASGFIRFSNVSRIWKPDETLALVFEILLKVPYSFANKKSKFSEVLKCDDVCQVQKSCSIYSLVIKICIQTHRHKKNILHT